MLGLGCYRSSYDFGTLGTASVHRLSIAITAHRDGTVPTRTTHGSYILHRRRPLAMEMPNKPAAPRPTASESADVDAAGAASAELAPSCRPGDQEDRSPPPSSPTPHIHEPHPFSTSSASPSSSSSTTSPLPGQPSPTAGPPVAEPASSSKPGQTSLPTSFPPIFFQPTKVPSASLAPSTAEGKPVRLADPADTRHTASALQKLNSKYPSAAVRRHGYAPEASSAQSSTSTYSQPVLVRTYSGPTPSQGSRSTRSRQYRPPSSNRGTSRRVPLPSASTPGSGGPGRPAQPTLTDVGVGTTSNISASISKRSNANIHTNSNDPAYNSNASQVNMSRPYKAEKVTPTATSTSTSTTTGSRMPLSWPWPLSSRREPEEPKLPPLDAFSFKSFMADLETRGSDSDIGADLDRIAEICARSRYSLSNQYEVHVAPHGSGASFTSNPLPPSVSRTREGQAGHNRNRSSGSVASTNRGPTLQAITSDDENPARLHSRRRAGNKRRSAAYGTLETIMSSSRSSDEDKSKKKSAAELVTEVRGRAARKTWDANPSASTSGSAAVSALESTSTKNNSSSASPDSTAEQQQQQGQQSTTSTPAITDATRLLARKKSASFANASISPSSVSASSSSHRNRRANNNKDDRGKQKTTTTAENAVSALASRQDNQGATTTSRMPHQELAAVQGGNPDTGRGSTGAGNTSVSAQSSSWGAWIPWRAGQQQEQFHARRAVGSHAEGSLRQLLRTRGD